MVDKSSQLKMSDSKNVELGVAICAYLVILIINYNLVQLFSNLDAKQLILSPVYAIFSSIATIGIYFGILYIHSKPLSKRQIVVAIQYILEIGFMILLSLTISLLAVALWNHTEWLRSSL